MFIRLWVQSQSRAQDFPCFTSKRVKLWLGNAPGKTFSNTATNKHKKCQFLHFVHHFIYLNLKISIFQGCGISQPVDKDVKTKIAELVEEDVRNVPEMQRHVKQFVKHEVFCNEGIPSSTNRRFHPSNTNVRNHMYTAQVKLRLSNVDQENLQALVEQWRKERREDQFLFRSFSTSAVGENECPR